MNTLTQGAYRWIIFKEGDVWYGLAYEFNIVVEGADSRLVEVELQEAVLGYLEAAKSMKGFRPQHIEQLLNQKAEDEYEEMWARATAGAMKTPKPELSPLSDIYKAGVSNLATV